MNFLRHRSVQVLGTVALYIMLAPYLPTKAHQFFYTISLFIREALVWVMPFTVMMFIAHTIFSFERRAPLFILSIMLFEALSNFSSVWYAYGAASVAVNYVPEVKAIQQSVYFEPLCNVSFLKPFWWSSQYGVAAGLFVGLVLAFVKAPKLTGFVTMGKRGVEFLLTRVFANLIPLFILGFVAHMYHTQLLGNLMNHYGWLILWLVGFILFYILGVFVLGAGLSVARVSQHIANLLPAGGVALTSGCSLSTMPWTISGTAKNLDDPELANAIIPTTTNIQQIGDCIANAFLCFLIYYHFYGSAPTVIEWAAFSFVFVLTRYATAAILGGAIFIMLPIYEAYLNFTPEMLAIILAFNVILDPIITSSNVVANGALCRVFERVWQRLNNLKIISKA